MKTQAGDFPLTNAATAAHDWRLQIPESRRRALRAWFSSIALVTVAVLIVGGVTRLTHSGLSIVNWDPIIGVIPPLSEQQWQQAFLRYQQFPEYQLLREGMTLGEFKVIFFWEYLHRLLARAIGLVFLIPFAFFAVRRWLNRPLAVRALFLFALGGMQGLMGWLMVASGLVDRPSVSHYRLAAHLSLAFLIFGYAVWLARELSVRAEQNSVPSASLRQLRLGLGVIGILLGIQIIWGAFVAGLKAGFFSNTFPLMGGRLVPADWLRLQPFVRNFFENPATVQWLHRLLGTLLLLAVAGFALKVKAGPLGQRTGRYAKALLLGVVLQYALGIATLLLAVPVALGVLHQTMALLLFGLWLSMLHHARQLRPA
jgi:cytochrome c oxidase assembly protein subunit 15